MTDEPDVAPVSNTLFGAKSRPLLVSFQDHPNLGRTHEIPNARSSHLTPRP